MGTFFDPFEDPDGVFGFQPQFEMPKASTTFECPVEDCDEKVCEDCSPVCENSDCDAASECDSASVVCHDAACSVKTTPCCSTAMTTPSDALHPDPLSQLEPVYTGSWQQELQRHGNEPDFGEAWKNNQHVPFNDGFYNGLMGPQNSASLGGAFSRGKDGSTAYCCWDGCETAFQSEAELGVHFNEFHLPSFPHHSHYDHGMLDLSASDHDHLQHGPDHQDWYVCCAPGCSEKFKTVDLLDNHFKTVHWPENNARVECRWNASHGKNCGMILTNDNLSTHVASDHLAAYKLRSDGRFIGSTVSHGLPSSTSACPEDESATFAAWQEALDLESLGPQEQRGSMSSETQESALACQWQTIQPDDIMIGSCGYVADNERDLQLHVERIHLEGLRKPQECICRWKGCPRFNGEPFSQRAKLERHIQSHTQDKPYQCTGFLLTNGDPCEKTFATLAGLEQHVRSHKKDQRYACDFPGCNKTFTASTSLTVHKRTHTGDKPLVCGINGCEKRFSESSNLTKHRKTHEEPTLKCRYCEKKFNRTDGLKRHEHKHEINLVLDGSSDKSNSSSPANKAVKRGREEIDLAALSQGRKMVVLDDSVGKKHNRRF